MLLVILFPIALRLAALPWLPVPQPAVHDEFSYLLAAETFSKGRLANPSHPHWQFFETFHVLSKPVYMSMYPPGQGLVMAVGILLFSHPWAGVLLSTTLFLASVYWLLLAVVPRRWALFGWLLAVLLLGVGHYWVNSYWGGAVAGIGGALLAGAYLRLSIANLSDSRFRWYLLVAAAGVAIMALSRPWEGLCISIPVGLMVGYWLLQRCRRTGMHTFFRLAWPGLVVIIAAVGFSMYNAKQITGSPLVPPHLKQRESYAISSLFLWEKTAPIPEYRHEEMRKFYVDWEPTFYEAKKFSTLSGWTMATIRRSLDVMQLGPAYFLAVLPALFFLRRFRRVRLLAVPLVGTLAGWALQRYVQLHYVAPVFGVIFALMILAARHAAFWKIRAGRLEIPVIAGALVGVIFALVGQAAYYNGPVSKFLRDRAAVIRDLGSTPGRDLVFVNYAPEHPAINREWVYNAARIDNAPIVWARYMTEERRRELLAYYPDRTAWVLEPDSEPFRLTKLRAPMR